MKKLILLTTLLAVAAFAYGDCGNCDKPCGAKSEKHEGVMEEDGEMKAMMEGEKLIYYTCPMEKCSSVHSSEAGKCPSCGMELVKGVVTDKEHMEFYGCPMEAHSHVREDKEGKCDECGMKLKPMRLAK